MRSAIERHVGSLLKAAWAPLIGAAALCWPILATARVKKLATGEGGGAGVEVRARRQRAKACAKRSRQHSAPMVADSEDTANPVHGPKKVPIATLIAAEPGMQKV